MSTPDSELLRTDDAVEMLSGDTVFESMLIRSENSKGPGLNISDGVVAFLMSEGRR